MAKSFRITALIAAAMMSAAAAESKPSAQRILESFAEDYQTDPMAIDGDFGIKVGEKWWNVTVVRKQAARPHKEKYTHHDFGPHQVALRKGKPTKPTWYFDIADEGVLRRIYDGSVNAGTAGMKSFGGDQVGVDMGDMEGFDAQKGDFAEYYHVSSHFWTKGAPEIVRFERGNSLPTHGADAVALYLMKDKRVIWFSIGKDATVNEDPRLEFGQVPNLFIFTKGAGKANFGTDEIDVHAGMSVFVAPYVKHVFSNPNDEPLEGILVLYGDNGDFVFGESYVDSIEAQYDFLGRYSVGADPE